MTDALMFEVVDPQAPGVEGLKQLVTPTPPRLNESLIPMPRKRNGMPTLIPEDAINCQDGITTLQETATGGAATSNFAALLRQGVTAYLFDAYNQERVTYPELCSVSTSDKQQEEYIIGAGLGQIPIVHEGEPAPKASPELFGSVSIKNYSHRVEIPITDEMRRFDKVGMVRQIAGNVGAALRRTMEQSVYDVLTTVANYNSTSASGENDIGNNYGTTTFSPSGLVTAYRTLMTMKDPRSGAHLLVNPNTLIITPGLWFAAQQLLRSPESMRAHSDADSTVVTVEVYGTGTRNPFFGFVDRIIVTPMLGSTYEWVLMDRSRNALAFQQVVAPMVEGPFIDRSRNVWSFFAQAFFGTGFVDDRFAYFSNSTTAPTTV